MSGFRNKCALGADLIISIGALCCSAALCVGQSTVAVSPSPAPPAPASQGVSYQNGRLTINTEGSTLAEVLQSVAGKIGAVIEIPAGSGGERIVEHANGSADEVITALLSGSEFNFVIVTSPGSPHVPTRVMLTSRSGGSAAASEVASADPAVASDPQLYGGGFSVSPEDEQAAQAAVAPPPAAGSGEQLSPEAIDAMVKERLRLRHLQQDQAAQQQPPPQ